MPGGLFYEVTGDLTFFVPKDDALEAEIEYWKEALGLSGNETVRENKAYVQEILRQYIAYGNVSVGYRGLFVTIDGSIFLDGCLRARHVEDRAATGRDAAFGVAARALR